MRYLMWSLICWGVVIPDINAQNSDSFAIGKVYGYVEHMPEPTFNIPDFLREQVHYPAGAVKKNIQGKTVVQFIVTEQGKVINPQVVKSSHILLDSESLRVVRLMPEWKPGVHEGKPVNVTYTLPIIFKLDDAHVLELYDSLQKEPLYAFAEKLPEPVVSLEDYFKEHIQLPFLAKEYGISGSVFLKCLIDENGKIRDALVLRSSHPVLDSEAIRVVKTLPKWRPAIINHKNTSVYFPIKVKFDYQLTKDNLVFKDTSGSIQLPQEWNDIVDFISKNVHYPEQARENNIQGRVFVSFCVDSMGNIKYPHIKNLGDPLLDAEALRVITLMPKWKPILKNGIPGKVHFTLPIGFKLE